MTRVKEEEQLYFVRKSANGAPSNGNGFRHHRPKEKRADTPAPPKVFDPANAQIDYADNERGAINKLLALNEYYRSHPWPKPFDRTEHRLRLGDARDLSWIPNGSVHLIVTSPPYWTLKKYEKNERQLGEIEDYNAFLYSSIKSGANVHECWLPVEEFAASSVTLHSTPTRPPPRDAAPCRHHGARPVSRSRRAHADLVVQNRKRRNGSEREWLRILRQTLSARAIIKNDAEYILFLRKGGEYRSPSSIQKALSMLTRDEMKSWLRSAWIDIKGESTRRGHPAPYPQSLAERLIKLFSFAGDTILDPFVGTGTTNLAAIATSRNSIGIEIEPVYLKIAEQRLHLATAMPRAFGARTRR